MYQNAVKQDINPVLFNSLNNLGSLYKDGFGVQKETQKAKELFEKAIQLGSSDALINLALIYEETPVSFIMKSLLNLKNIKNAPNYQKAIELYEKAIQLEKSSAMINLGNMYFKGKGVKQDFQKAKELYEKGILLGYSNGYCNLGVMYQNGHGVKPDCFKAKELFEKSIQLGNTKAQNNLSILEKQILTSQQTVQNFVGNLLRIFKARIRSFEKGDERNYEVKKGPFRK